MWTACPEHLNVTLGQFVPLQEFQSDWWCLLQQVWHQVCLPTEVVVAGPEIVMPRVARQYRTGFYWYDGRICSYKELYAAVLATGQVFPGTYHYDEIYFVEVWENFGDDGHVEYRQVGWRFVLAAALADDPKSMYPKVPECMRSRLL
jgi:hypothetical protein